MENEKSVAIYCRLSIEDKEKIEKGDDSESIQNQRLLLTDYAQQQGWSIYNIYSDDDYSGLDRNRPEFTQMIKDAEKGKFDIILCKTQSRFTRDMELVEKYLHNRFPIWGIRFVSVVDNVDTDIKGNKKARQIYGLINEWYCEDLSENIRYVFRQKMQDGQYLGAFAPYGYKKSSQDHHKLEIDEEAAEVVKKIFDMYIEGYGSRQIAKVLTDLAIMPPTVYKQSKGYNFATPNADKYVIGHGVWAINTIRRILQNRVYIGMLIQGREKKLSYKSNKVVVVPEDEWIVVENAHEPIIDEKLFNDVQTLMEGRRIHRAPKDGNYKGMAQAHVLAGKVKCEDCGNPMTKSATGRNGDKYLRCSLYHKTQSTLKKCNPHTIKLNTLTQLVEDKIRILINEYIQDESERSILKEFCSKQDDIKNQISTKEKELIATEKRHLLLSQTIANSYIDKSTGILSENEFLSIKQRLNDEMQEISNKQSTITNQIQELKIKQETFVNADEILRKHINFTSLTNAIVNDFIDFIEVGDKSQLEQKVTIHWLF